MYAMMSRTKNAASEPMNEKTATFEAGGRDAGNASSGPTAPSGAAGYATSQSGRRLRMGGSAWKLSGGGGDVVAHSSVHALQGLSPATAPARSERARLTTSTSADAPRMNEPIVDTMLSAAQCGKSGYVYTR